MAEDRLPLLLPTVFGAFGITSFMTSATMLINPEFGWKVFGISSEKRSIAGICYASAVMGEAVLQWCACVFPEAFLIPTVIFMVPYKLTSAAGLIWYGIASKSAKTRRETTLLAMQWLAPVALVFGVAHLDARQSRKSYFDA